MSDNVEHPSHYSTGNVETIDAIKSALGDAFLDYCRGNVLKYVWRCRHKGKLLEDLRKAAKYLEWAIAEAENENPSKPQELAIPEGWRELEENEPLCEDDLFDFDGEWVGHEYDPSGGVYSSRIHRRHIRKIETDKPEHVEGVWVEEADANAKKIEPTETSDASIPDPGEGYRLLSKDPPEDLQPGDEFWCYTHWTKWWPSCADCGSAVQSKHDYYRRKIETENPSEIPNSSLPDPGPGYRLLSKDPPERVVEGVQFWDASTKQWHDCKSVEGHEPQVTGYYYRRKIEPTEWVPKVGDKVRVVRGFANPVGETGIIKNFCPVVNGNFSILAGEGRRTWGWFKKDDVELIEAAQ